jgi:predicted nucleotidyltransferase
MAILFGSIIKGMERADSDIDIFIVCKGDKSGLEEKLKDLITFTQNKFGNPVSLLIKHYEELEDLKTKSIYKELKNGEVIFKREEFEW